MGINLAKLLIALWPFIKEVILEGAKTRRERNLRKLIFALVVLLVVVAFTDPISRFTGAVTPSESPNGIIPSWFRSDPPQSDNLDIQVKALVDHILKLEGVLGAKQQQLTSANQDNTNLQTKIDELTAELAAVRKELKALQDENKPSPTYERLQRMYNTPPDG